MEKHPHVRGEDKRESTPRIIFPETPPRAWGRHAESLGYEANNRNTPTCVGKTYQGREGDTCERKHPHVRGEDEGIPPPSASCRETPPRAWGRRKHPADFSLYQRNTPTCVGKTEVVDYLGFAIEKHPHVRGEDGYALGGKALPEETPPRAWGRPEGLTLATLEKRNTPTCVGKT